MLAGWACEQRLAQGRGRRRSSAVVPAELLDRFGRAGFASEISAVTKSGGEALLRERVGALEEDQLRLLREALDEVAVA
jgi:hypothetical protein